MEDGDKERDFTMGMVIKNNMSAKNSLNSVNKNSKALSKSLKKVASGMKINSAADGASEWSISEGMRAQIRSLDQANVNTQNGRSLLRVADGVISNTVDIMRTMKEKAINAANDTNTDSDRAIIQKELDQLIDQVNDNANVTFNGKIIFDGALHNVDNNEQRIVTALHTEWINNSLELIEQSTGLSFHNTKGIKEMGVYFADEGANGTLAYVGSGYNTATNKTNELFLVVNMNYYKDMVEGDANGKSNIPGAGYLDRTIAHEMTHAVMSSNIDGFSDLYACFKEGAAEVIHGIDDERKASIAAGGHSGKLTTATTATLDSYSSGYVMFRYMAAQCGFSATDSVKHFMQSLSDGEGAMTTDRINAAIAAGSKGKFTSFDGLKASMAADETKAGSTDAFLKNYCDIDLDNLDTGAISGSDAGESRGDKTAESVVPEGGSTKFWVNPLQKESNIQGLTVQWQNGAKTFSTTSGDKTVHSADIQIKGGMRFHTGTKASQNLHIAFAYADAKAMGLQDDNNNNLQVTTLTKAKAAIALIDNSLAHALDQQTMIGATSNRLEYTAMNLTVASENVTAAESVIRDADMAKEMTEYTKNNVLMQAAQSMLAQANQNSSNAINLLQ